ncbi:hypothetical protein TcasGA2_TC003340 [Tribolium castaneum]|uniref:Uncharacterized protein n=1 Tax=Tribolium castaneum TaxID=7070 RepID=D6WFB8_TRICA|nr:hypothetical protein TcasGA2_TC003340 [Tribolium castaneum]
MFYLIAAGTPLRDRKRRIASDTKSLIRSITRITYVVTLSTKQKLIVAVLSNTKRPITLIRDEIAFIGSFLGTKKLTREKSNQFPNETQLDGYEDNYECVMTVDKVFINLFDCFFYYIYLGSGSSTRHIMSKTTTPPALYMQMETCRVKLIKMKMGFRPICEIIKDRSTLMSINDVIIITFCGAVRRPKFVRFHIN